MINVGVIGYGYWGPNLVRNFIEAGETCVAGVSDLDPSRLALLRTRYPHIRVTGNAAELIQDPTVDAIAICTPVNSHFELAMAALKAGKHIFVEKPIADSAVHALRLTEEASRRKLILMVDHTFVYTGAVRKIRELVQSGALGEIYYYDSVRVNLGLFQHDVDVMWDLAVHDLSIMQAVLKENPLAVSATGMIHVAGRPTDVAFLTLFFGSSLIAHLHVNWLSPVKLRRTLIGANRKMIVYDDLESSDKVKIYDKGITVTNMQSSLHDILVSYRTGDMWSPRLENTEALLTEVRHFSDCIQQNRTPLTDGVAGVRVVQILEAASRSAAERGRPIEVVQVAAAAV
jgi:predicted dehydrogenase